MKAKKVLEGLALFLLVVGLMLSLAIGKALRVLAELLIIAFLAVVYAIMLLTDRRQKSG